MDNDQWKLIEPNNPFFQKRGDARTQRWLKLYIRKLKSSFTFRMKVRNEYKILIGYFLRHEDCKFLWENDPLEIEKHIFELQDISESITDEEFPQLHETLKVLKEIAMRSRGDRESHLRKNKIIPLKKRAPHEP